MVLRQEGRVVNKESTGIIERDLSTLMGASFEDLVRALLIRRLRGGGKEHFALFCADTVPDREKESLGKEGVTVCELKNLNDLPFAEQGQSAFQERP